MAAAVRSRYSNFWARCGSGAVGFLILSPRRGGGALAFFFYRRGAVAVSFLPPAEYVIAFPKTSVNIPPPAFKTASGAHVSQRLHPREACT